MRAMPLEEQAAEAVGYDVWFSLPDMEKAELVEELVKSGTIVPTASETDVRIMELIEQDEYEYGGEIFKVGDRVKYKDADSDYSAVVVKVVNDVRHINYPYAVIKFVDRDDLEEAYLEDLERVELRVADEYVNTELMDRMRKEWKEKHGTTKLARGGFDVGRWYRDSSGEEFKYVGEDMKGNTLFNDGVRTIKKPIEDFDSIKEEKLFGWFAEGGVATGGKFIVKYYLKETPETIKTKVFDDKDGAEFFFETIQDDDDIVVMPIEEVMEEVKPAPAKGKNLFSAAKPVPVAKTAAKKRERVQVDGIADEIERYDALKAIINNAKAEQEIIGGRLKEIGREKFLDLYEDRGFRPPNFDLADGNENILLEITDKYLKVEPEKAAILENYDGLLEVKTTYEFNPEILEKSVSDSMTVGDVVSMLIQDSKLLSDSDKENLIKAKTTMRVPKGTIDRLLDYDNPREVFNLISPILALK